MKEGWTYKKFDEVFYLQMGKTPSRDNSNYWGGDNVWVSIADLQGKYIDSSKESISDAAVSETGIKLVPKDTVIMSFKLSVGRSAITTIDLYTNEAIAALIPINTEELLDKYLYCLFSSRIINLEQVGNKAFGKSLNSTYLKNEVMIPVPPIQVQRQVITEYEKIDEEYNTTRMSIDTYRQRIEEIFNKLGVANSGGGTD